MEKRSSLDAAYWWYYGELGQKIVELTRFKSFPKGLKIVDGHNLRTYSNLINEEDYFYDRFAYHLDIIVWNPKTKEIKSVCEVKTTINKTKKEFEAHGRCQYFMKLAQKNKIPIHFAVVRLDRLISKDIVLEKDGKILLNKIIFNEELKFFLKTAKVEFYGENEFLMENNKFIIKK